MFDIKIISNLICFDGISDGNKYKGGIYMVFEYMDHDLTGLADRPGMRFSVAQIKVSQTGRLASYLITDYLRFEALSFTLFLSYSAT